MLLRLFLCAVVLFSFVYVSSDVLAQEQTPAENAQDKEEAAKAQRDTLNGKVSNLIGDLTPDEILHFSSMYSSYTLYSAVKAVREDVGNAAEACSENNKSMAKEIDRKYQKWEKSVGDKMEEAFANINNLALAQTYMPQSDVKQMFALVDELRSKNSSRFEKIPVTTPEACEFMLSKMDETEESMNSLLSATLMSYPSVLKKSQE